MAALQLVSPAPLPPMPMHHEPRVFSPSFVERLGRLNEAERQLRQMGLQVVWTRIAGPLPQAHILRDAAVSLAKLMDRMGPRSYRNENGGLVVSGEFMGCIVSWVEPQ